MILPAFIILAAGALSLVLILALREKHLFRYDISLALVAVPAAGAGLIFSLLHDPVTSSTPHWVNFVAIGGWVSSGLAIALLVASPRADDDGSRFQLKLRWLHYGIYVLLCVGTAFAHVVQLHELLTGVLVGISLVAFPYLLGTHLILALWPRVGDVLTRDLHWLVAPWVLGTLVITLFAMFAAEAEWTWGLKHLGVLTLASAGLLMFVNSLRLSWWFGHVIVIRRSTAAALVTVCVIALVPKLIMATYTPFPIIEGNFVDPYVVGQDAVRIAQDGYLRLDEATHPPPTIVLTSIGMGLFKTTVLPTLWSVPIVLYLVFSVGVYLWVLDLTKHRGIAVLSVAFALFLLTGPPPLESTPGRFRSNTVILTSFPYAALFLQHAVRSWLAKMPTDRPPLAPLLSLGFFSAVIFIVMNVHWFGLLPTDRRLLVTALVTLVVIPVAGRLGRTVQPSMVTLMGLILLWQWFHTFEAPLYIAALLSLGLVLIWKVTRPALLLAMVAGSAAIVSGILALSPLIQSPTTLTGFILKANVGEFNLIDQKIYPLRVGLSDGVRVLLIAASAVFLVRRSSFRLALIAFPAPLLALSFLPDIYFGRAARPLALGLTPLAAVGSYTIVRALSSRLKFGRPVRWLGLAVIVPVFALFLIQPFYSNFSNTRDQSYHSHMADFELAVLRWFETNASTNLRIISDYQTMQLLPPMLDMPNVVAKRYQVHEMSETDQERVGFIKHHIFNSKSPDHAWASIMDLASTAPEEERRYLAATDRFDGRPDIYVVVTGRTSAWLNQDGLDAVRPPVRRRSIGDGDTAVFEDPRYFQEVFRLGQNARVYYVRYEPMGDGLRDVLSFDGENDYVEIPDSATLDIMDAVTVEAWVDRPSSLPRSYETRFRSIVSKGPWVSPYSIHWDSGKDNPPEDSGTFGLHNGTSTLELSFALPEGLHHIAATWDGSTARVYVDGDAYARASFSGPLVTSTEDLYIGQAGDDRFFPGLIREVRIWNYARSQAEVQADMHKELTGSETGLAGYWKLGEGSGTIAYDSTPNGNHGTIKEQGG